ncbi:response regulator transcription factor [Pedobacter sp.]|uniref:response regulator transcription factor n=1 Tax=Pedobacter sp. TaxID=1411316 RepID=UPI003D7FBCA4
MKQSKALQQDFTKQLAKLKLVADQLPAAIIVHCVVDLHVVYMNQPAMDAFGIEEHQISELNKEGNQASYFNTIERVDYIQQIHCLIQQNTEDMVCYFQQIRNQRSLAWLLFVSNTKVFYRNSTGEATYLITTSNNLEQVQHFSPKIVRMVDEMSFLQANNPLFLKLTKREKEVLRCIALGMNSGEISNSLFISPATVDTHRRNLRSKLCLKNNYDTVRFAQAYNLV